MTRRNLTGRQSTRRRHRLAAYTLVEILVVVTLLVFLLACISMAIGTLVRAQGRLEDDLQQATQMARLDAQLRSDAHQAGAVEQPEEDRIVFHLRSQRIEYVTETNMVVRSLRQDEEVLHREVFPLAAKTTIVWTITRQDDSAMSSPILSAMVTFEPEDPTRGTVVDRLDAAVGLHARPAP